MNNIVKGDTLNLTYENSLYSPADYDIWVALRGASNIDLKSEISDVTISSTGNIFTIVATAALTSTWVIGDYWYAVYCGKSSWAERYTAETGTLSILADIEAQTAIYDDRSHVKRMLDAIEATIEGRVTKDATNYSIGSRSIAKTPISELLSARDKYRAEYRAELQAQRIAAGLAAGNLIKVRL